jgi:hypothetical protein
MKPWYFAATFAAGFALCYAISGWNQFTASDKLKQAEADKQEAQPNTSEPFSPGIVWIKPVRKSTRPSDLKKKTK